MTGLAVTSLHLSHFRSYQSTRIDVEPRPVALVGPNGAGKTNILEALSILSPGRGLRRAAADDLCRQPDAIGWKVAAKIESLGRPHEVATWSEPQSARQVTIDGKTAPQAALGKITRMVWLVPTMDRLWLEGADGRRRFLDRIALSFEPRHAEVSLVYEKTMRDRNRLLKDRVDDPAWFDALETQMSAAGAEIAANRAGAVARLMEAQETAQTHFPTADLSIHVGADQLPWADGDDLKEVLASHRRADIFAGRTLIGPHRADLEATYRTKGVSARQCSTGEQKALLISVILANARALTEDFGAPPIVLLDEVAAHLDENRRAALYDEICALGAQAWMTGTEIGLFEPLGDRSLNFAVQEQDGASQLCPI